jgi:hypothetical protein
MGSTPRRGGRNPPPGRSAIDRCASVAQVGPRVHPKLADGRLRAPPPPNLRYNIAEPSRSVSVEKARRELGWDPDFRSKGEL